MDWSGLQQMNNMILDALIIQNNERNGTGEESLEESLSRFFQKGSTVIYRISLTSESGWISETRYRNPLLLSDMYFQWFTLLAGDRARVFRQQGQFLLIYPEDFKISKDLLEHQLNLKLQDYNRENMENLSDNLFSIESEVFQQMNEGLLQFIEEGSDGPSKD